MKIKYKDMMEILAVLHKDLLEEVNSHNLLSVPNKIIKTLTNV